MGGFFFAPTGLSKVRFAGSQSLLMHQDHNAAPEARGLFFCTTSLFLTHSSRCPYSLHDAQGFMKANGPCLISGFRVYILVDSEEVIPELLPCELMWLPVLRIVGPHVSPMDVLSLCAP